MVICLKKQKQCCAQELETGDCWIGLSLADSSGLILAARVGKHTDELIDQLVKTPREKRIASNLTVMIGADMSESYLLKFNTTFAKTKPSD